MMRTHLNTKCSTDSESSSKQISVNRSAEKETTDSDSVVQVGDWEDAPEFLRDNEYIRKGYRIRCNSCKSVLKTLFMSHNESLNIWSHLCGAILFLFLTTYIAIWVTPRFVFPSYQIIKNQLSCYLTAQNCTIPPDFLQPTLLTSHK